MGALTDRSERYAEFARHYVANGGNGAAAARACGAKGEAAKVAACRWIRMPEVQERVRREQFLQLNGPLASKALGVLEQVLDDPEAPSGARVDAARAVLDRAGLVLSEQPDRKPEDKQAASLSGLLAKLEAAIALRQAAKVPALIDQPA